MQMSFASSIITLSHTTHMIRELNIKMWEANIDSHSARSKTLLYEKNTKDKDKRTDTVELRRKEIHETIDNTLRIWTSTFKI